MGSDPGSGLNLQESRKQNKMIQNMYNTFFMLLGGLTDGG